MNKKWLILSIVMSIVVLMTACTPKDEVVVNQPVDNKPTATEEPAAPPTTTDGVDDSDYDPESVIAMGEIMGFEENAIHILSGDMVMTKELDGTQMNGFYRGQQVVLVEEEGERRLIPHIVEDFSVRFTTMGDRLSEAKGVVTATQTDAITLDVDGEALTLKTFDDYMYLQDMMVTVIYGDFGDGPAVTAIYDEAMQMEMTIVDIRRSDDGWMLLSLEDADGGPYEISTQGAILEINLSLLKVGDTLLVDHDGIMESYPMQMIVKRISQP